MPKKRILVAILNWGLGHATRCIPIINELLKNNCEVFIASDGAALQLLEKEFTDIVSFELPSYSISYSKSAGSLKWKLITEIPKILQAVKKEKRIIKTLVEKHQLDGIISDNRLGCRHELIKCVFITHQYNVLSGNTTYLSSKIHQRYILKFDECWIPDSAGNYNLSGIMGHLKIMPKMVKYIGPLSRFNKLPRQKKFDYAVILSGPEPQRTILEKKLITAFENSDKKIIFIRGVITEKTIATENKNLIIKNYLTTETLQDAILSSEAIICRSGYSSVMDLAKLKKKVFFIPTPDQFEQEYLARRFMEMGVAPFSTQENFELSQLECLKEFSGFSSIDVKFDFREIFALFKSK